MAGWLVAGLALGIPSAQAGSAPAVTFYVPFPEADYLAALQAIENGGPSTAPADPVTTYISIATIADGTVIYYDHWEDGYENSLRLGAPLQATTEIWGDNNPANGLPPGFTNDYIHAGNAVLLYNQLASSVPLAIDFDARDKIEASRAVSITRTFWTTGPDTLLAGSFEVFDTTRWGLDFRAPVGQNIPDGSDVNAGDHQMFEYTGLSVIAAKDDTTVRVDADNNGVFETTNVLGQGETLLVNGGVNVGGRVLADQPVSVILITGDVASNYESRDSTLLPLSLWSRNYYTPVSTPGGDGTRVWLYNPAAATITIHYDTRSGTNAIVTAATNIAAGSYGSVLLATNTAARFYSGDGETGPVFYAYSTTDSDVTTTSDNQAWDWSFTLIPDTQLVPQLLVGLGIGRDPTSAINPGENGNPVWVTTVGNGESNVAVYVDYDGDGAGPLTDPNGFNYDAGYSVRELQQLKIYDPDGDQSSMLVYVLASNVNLAGAWGQDPLAATAGAPGLDVGTSIPPMDVLDASKDLTLVADLDGDGYLGPGERAEYLITVGNTTRAIIPAAVFVVDELPPDTTYVPGSTFYRVGSNGVWVAVADDPSGTPFPLDGTGIVINAEISIRNFCYVKFQVDVKPPAELSAAPAIVNTGAVWSTTFDREIFFENETFLHGSLGDYVWLDADRDGVQDPAEPGLANVIVYADINTNGVRDAGEPMSTTSSNGYYLLAGGYLIADTYSVRVDSGTLPAGLLPTFDLDGTGTSHQATVDLAPGEDRTDVDFGYVAAAALGDFTWIDSNGNGRQDAGEPALAGVVVRLYDAASNVVGVTTSSAAGGYAFTDLLPGTYVVGFTPPAGYQSTLADTGADATDSDAHPDTGLTGGYVLTGGQVDNSVDAGFYNPAHVSLKLYKSTGLSGDWDLGATNDYYLTLRNTGTVALAGVALADALPPGVAFVAGSAQIVRLTTVATNPFSFTLADEFAAVSYANNDGTTNWLDNWTETGDNGLPNTGNVLVRVSGGTTALTFENKDADNDTITRAHALPLPPGRVYTNATLRFAYRRTRWDANDSLALHLSTNGFAGQSNLVFLVPGQSVTDPGYTAISTNVLSYVGATTTLRLRAGPEFANQDRIEFDYVRFEYQGLDIATNPAALYVPGETRVDVVSNLPAATPAALLENVTLPAGTTVTVRLRATLGAPLATTQLVNTAVATSPATPPVTATATNGTEANSVGDRAWLDANGNGIQDGGEAGLPGATVRLYDGASNWLATTETDADGLYEFAYLPRGTYFLEFEPPAGFERTPADEGGDDGLDSDANPATGRTPAFALAGGVHDATRDAGFYRPAALGDFAWEDLDGNGRQDAGEPGLGGVAITLYDAAANVVGATTSSAAGAYAFANLRPGTYFVEFRPPAGYILTVPGVGDAAGDSDPARGDGRTPLVELASGETNATLDAGGYRPVTIGDWIWFDSDRNGIQDAAETNGVPGGIPVALVGTNGQIVAETVANAEGRYRFENVPQGTYSLRFDLAALTTNEMLSPAQAGADPELDSDAISGNSGDYAWTAPLAFAGGATNLAIDLGIAVRGTFRAALVEVRGERAGSGRRVVWRTDSEFLTGGFHVYRVEPETGVETRVNERLVFSALREEGATYALADSLAGTATTGVYRIEELELTGERRDLGTHAVRFEEVASPAEPAVSARPAPAARPRARAAPRAFPETSPVQKVAVSRDGIYGVELDALAAGMGLSPGTVRTLAASNGLAIANQGEPVPWLYDAAGGRLLFRGEEPEPNWYLHETTYLIRPGPGTPLPRRAPGAGGGETVFPVRLRFEEDLYLFSMVRMPADFYFWLPVQYGWTNDVPLDLAGYAGGDLKLKVRLMGYLGSLASPNHLARFWFNGAPAGAFAFDGQEELEVEMTIPGASVSNGVNTLSLDEGAVDGAFVVDWIEASFNRHLAPRAEPVEFLPGAAATVSAAAFADPLAFALDAAGRPTWIVEENGQLPGKTWTIVAGDVRFMVAERDAIPALAPESAAADAWFMAADNSVDYLVIASRALAGAAQELADYRAGQGLRTGVAVFEDACDLLAGGRIGPEAIPALLRRAATTWAKAPEMVVLCGSGHYDYAGLNTTNANHLPPMLVQVATGVRASDNLLADTGGNDLPDVAIGRLPARTPAQLTAMVAKIKAYETEFGAAWQNRISLAADPADGIGDFSAENDKLAALATPPYSVGERIDLDELGIGPARTNFLRWFNEGVGFIHFTGHGERNYLGKSNLLGTSRVAAMTNALRPPIVVALTCLAARYDYYVGGGSLADLLLQRAGGGAVAVLGPSGFSRNAPAADLAAAFYAAVFQERAGRLGPAFLKARRAMPPSIFTEETLAVYNLLGDPALRIAGNVETGAPPVAAQVMLSDLAQTYDGSPRPATITTVPAGLAVRATYAGELPPPTAVGAYAVAARVVTAGYEGAATGTLTIARAAAEVVLSGLEPTYDGAPKSATVATDPAGLTVEITYGGGSVPPANAGAHEVVATVVDANYASAATGILTIAKAPVAVTLENLTQTFDASPRVVTAATDPAGLAVEVTYNGRAKAPVAAGTYVIAAVVVAANHQGSATGLLKVARKPANILLGKLRQSCDGTRRNVTATTVPPGLPVEITYDGSPEAPVSAGTYAVAARIGDPDFAGAAADTLVVEKGAAGVNLGRLTQVYDGLPKRASVATDPAGLAVELTYAGSPAPPTEPGNYAVAAVVADPDYTGSAQGTFKIVDTTNPFRRWLHGLALDPWDIRFAEERDADGDGRTTYEEFIADTNPEDPCDVFAVEGALDVPGGSIRMSFPVSTERFYQLECATNLFLPTRVVDLGWGWDGEGHFATNAPGQWFGTIRVRRDPP